MISNQDEEERERRSQANTSKQTSKITDIMEIKTDVLPQLDTQTVTTTNASQLQSSCYVPTNKEDKVLARIPYFNGKTNIYAWLMAVKSVFIDLKYDEHTWANKAKYYLLDHAAQFVYLNDDQMANWSVFQKLMIDQYSVSTTTSNLIDSLTDTPVGSTMTSQQQTVYPSDALSQKAHHALVLEDLKTLPKFSGEGSQPINSWLEEIELVYDKAFINDTDRCSRTLKLLSNADEEWLEFIRRQKLGWSEFKQKLQSRFECKKDSSRIQREDDVRNRRYCYNESMHHYYSDIMRKCDLLEEEYPVSDRHRIDYIIRGLPDSIQDQLLTREYLTPKELLEVLQKIEEHRKRANFEQHVFSIEENTYSQATKTTPSLRTFQTTNNIQQQYTGYKNNTFHNNQAQNRLPSSYHHNMKHLAPTHAASNYNQKHRSIQCYNCGRFGHKAADCFKPKQHLN